MARSFRALSAACAFGLSLGSSTTDDSSALVQVGTQLLEKRQGKGILTEIAEMAVEQAKALRSEVDEDEPLQMMQQHGEPTYAKDALWYGMLFERQVMKMEEGTTAMLTFDHGCKERDAYGDNYCEFPHGDSVHVKLEFRLSKPIKDGYFAFVGQPYLQGVIAVLKNNYEGTRQNAISTFLQSKLQHMQVECPICGDTCDAYVLGKKKLLKLPPCPLPANENITLFEADVDLPAGDLLSIVGMQMQADLVMNRQDGEATTLISHNKVVMKMGRIYHGMPTIM